MTNAASQDKKVEYRMHIFGLIQRIKNSSCDVSIQKHPQAWWFGMWQELSLPIILSSSKSEGEGKWTLISGIDSLAFSSTFRSVSWARGSRVFSSEHEEGGTDNEWDITQRCPCFCSWCLSLPCRLITHGFHKHMAGWWLSCDYFMLWGTHWGPVTLFFHFSISIRTP